MRWTSDKPTVPGWYWWRQKPGGVLAIVEFASGVRYPLYGGRYFKPQGGEWSGPLTPPDDQAKEEG